MPTLSSGQRRAARSRLISLLLRQYWVDAGDLDGSATTGYLRRALVMVQRCPDPILDLVCDELEASPPQGSPDPLCLAAMCVAAMEIGPALQELGIAIDPALEL